MSSAVLSGVLGGLRANALTDRQLAALDKEYGSSATHDDDRPLTRDDAITNGLINAAKDSVLFAAPGAVLRGIAAHKRKSNLAAAGHALAMLGSVYGGIAGSSKFSGGKADELLAKRDAK